MYAVERQDVSLRCRMRGEPLWRPFALAISRENYGSSEDEATETELPAENLISCVAILVNAVDKGISNEVLEYALTSAEFNLLRTCAESGPCTATQLAGILPVDASRISRTVTRLVNLGLLRRQRLRNDRRVILLHLTDKGIDLTSRVDERVKVHVSRLLEGVTEDEMGAFTSLASKIAANYGALRESR